MRRQKRIPGLRVVRRVRHWDSVERCTWCGYPMVMDQPEYKPEVGGVPLGVLFCTPKCCEVEARIRGRGPLVFVQEG